MLAGPEMPNFRRHIAACGFPPSIRQLGVLTDEQKRDFFAGIDLFALPSRSDSFGLVLLEAWANGLPNLAYRAGGIAGVIRHGEDGLLVRCGDVTGLAEAPERGVGGDGHVERARVRVANVLAREDDHAAQDEERIVAEATRLLDDPIEYARMTRVHNPYGDGQASRRIWEILGQRGW